MAIDLVSALLSLLTVATYIAQTYEDPRSDLYASLRLLDLVCSFIFAAEWGFWLWTSHDRLRFAFSLQSVVDLVTVVPMVAAYFAPRGSFDIFERLVRLLRILRVFRIFRWEAIEVAGRDCGLQWSSRSGSPTSRGSNAAGRTTPAGHALSGMRGQPSAPISVH
jgi:hypothetical protein